MIFSEKVQTAKEEYRLPDLWRGNKYQAFIESRTESYRQYRSKWVDIPRKFEVLDFPIHVSIDTNALCNLRCPMCYKTINLNLPSRHSEGISFDIYRKIIDECSENGLMALRLNKKNEPLLTKNLPEYVYYAKGKGVIDVMINTNATLLTEEKGKLLIEAGLDKLNLSIDSHVKEDYEAIRVGAKFKDVYEKVKNFFCLRQKMNSVTPFIRIGRVTKSSEIPLLEDFTEYWAPFCDEITFSYCADFSASGQWFDQQKIRKEEVLKKVGLCPQPWQRLEIDYGGEVYPCCNEQDDLIIGNIFHQSIKAIWKSEKANRLREMIRKADVFSKKECKDCYACQYFTL